MRNPKILQKGVSLIEVLITLVVLGMGLMSLAKFQGTVMKDNSVGKERTVAIHLAQQKLEDLRNFSTLKPDPLDPLKASYQGIGTNLGGRITAGTTLALPIGAVSSTELDNSNVQYTRTWKVQSWYYDNTATGVNARATMTAPTPAPSSPPLKQVLVTIKWPDKTGAVPADCAFPTESPPANADTRVCLISFINQTNPTPP